MNKQQNLTLADSICDMRSRKIKKTFFDQINTLRSLIEPHQAVAIKSMIDEHYPETDFSEHAFVVNTTNPQKTFLGKLILLHEEFQKPTESIRHLRMSRHFYDLGQILDSGCGQEA